MLDFSKVKAVDEAVYTAMMEELNRQQTNSSLLPQKTLCPKR